MAANIEKRLETLEREVAELQRSIKKKKTVAEAWYIKNAGMFKDDPVFDAIVEKGREYRESLRPKPSKRATKSN